MNIMIALGAAVIVAGLAARPAAADCASDLNEVRTIIHNMAEGPAKRLARHELKMAEDALAHGDGDACLVHVGLCSRLAAEK